MSCTAVQKKLCGVEACGVCYQRSFATHARAAQWSALNQLKAHQVALKCNKKFLFDCGECGHALEMQCNNVAKGQWCKYCSSSALCADEACKFCFEKSFASHPMAAEWASRNPVAPRTVCKRSDMNAWFDCAVCNHSFQIPLFITVSGKVCKFCTNQALCNDDCNTCLKKSCASNERMVEEWSTKNAMTPRQVFLQSNKKMVFNCKMCHHEYTTTPNHYSNAENSQCSYCSNRLLCDKECDICFQKSFASHPRMVSWSTKNTLIPRQTFKGSEKRGIFNCETCNSEFSSMLYNVLTGYWCPFCKNKTEGMLQRFLGEQFECKTQVRFPWCRFTETKRVMPFDFMVGNVLIELDGEQHFSQVSNWGSHEDTRKKDLEKINHAIANGYSVIHLLQKDVWNNLYDWKTVLREEIERMQKAVNPQCVFLQSCEKYNHHAEQIVGAIVNNPKMTHKNESSEDVNELEVNRGVENP